MSHERILQTARAAASLLAALTVACSGGGAESSTDVTGSGEAVCGDGALAADEECDDGNAEDGDGCTHACTLEYCGDGVVQALEECDENTHACTWDCKWRVCAEDDRLFASDVGVGSGFGDAVAVTGDTIFIGAPLADGAASESGAVYLCELRGDGLWIETARLVADDGERGDAFGFALATSGDELIVGALDNLDTGAAYVFERGDEGWVQVDKLRASDAAEPALFGFDVAVDGDVLVVGSTGRGKLPGAAYVFERGANGWQEAQKLDAGNGFAWDIFGYRVAVDGDVLVVTDDDGTQVTDLEQDGLVYIFAREQDGWALATILSAPDEASAASFGSALAIDEGVLMVGSIWADGAVTKTGSVHVYEEVDGAWTETQTLLASDGVTSDYFGTSLALERDVAVVGAVRVRVDDQQVGAAYVFTKGDDGWSEEYKLLAPGGEDKDEFGERVAIGGERLVISSPGSNSYGHAIGSVYLFPAP